jgi:hypothetical protein
LNNEDKQYFSECFSDAYSDIGRTMYYIVNTSGVNLFNEEIKQFDEAGKTQVFGFYSRMENFDPAYSSQGNGRIDGKVTFVATPLYEIGITLKYGDAIDIPNELGITERYVVTGFVDKNESYDIFARLYVTRLAEIS